MKQAQKDLDDKKAEMDKLLAMITLSMEGKCPFSPEDLKARIEAVKAEMCKLEAISQTAETEYRRQDAALLQSLQLSKELVSYAEMYDLATLEEKRAIVAKLVKRVDVGKGTDGEYKVEIAFVVAEEHR